MPTAVRLLLLVFFLIFAPVTTAAQTFEAVGSRALGMAGAFVAVADDASATYWNPAGLASGPIFGLLLERQKTDPQSSFNFAIGTPPLGLTYYRLRGISLGDAAAATGADRQNVRSGEAGAGTLLTQHFGATVVQSLTPGLALATTLKIVHGTAEGPRATTRNTMTAAADVNGSSRTTVDLDAGLLAVFGPWRAGLVGRNLRQPTFGEHIRLDRQIRAGFAFAPRSSAAGPTGPMTLAVDLDLARSDTVSGGRRELAVGAERWWLAGRFGARGGVRLNTITGDDHGRDLVVAIGLSVSPRSGAFVEGQITRGQQSEEDGWGIGVRVTF